jgi:hypothetical protein
MITVMSPLLRSLAFIIINFLSLDINREAVSVLNSKQGPGRMEKQRIYLQQL